MPDDLSPPDATRDPRLLRIVVAFLGATVLASVVGGIALAAFGIDMPPGVTQVGSVAIGAMSALLSHALTRPPRPPAEAFAPRLYDPPRGA